MSQRYISSMYRETPILHHHVDLTEGSLKSGKTKKTKDWYFSLP